MKVTLSILLVFVVGFLSVGATSKVSSKTVSVEKKTVNVNWSTLKCEKYSPNGSANYFVKNMTGVWYKIKDKKWDCIANSAKYNFDIKQCSCKVLYPNTSSGGGDDDDNSCTRGTPGCGGGTTTGTTGGDEGGGETTGTTDGGTLGGDDGGETTVGTTGGDEVDN